MIACNDSNSKDKKPLIPDIEKAFFTLEQRTQEKDLIIEAAIEWLQSQS